MVDARILLPHATVSPPPMELVPLFGATFRTFGRAVVPLFFLGLLIEAPNLAFVASGAKFFSAAWGLAYAGQLLLQYGIAPVMTVMAMRLLLGAPMTLGSAVREGLARSLPNLGAMLLSLLVILATSVLLIVPGIVTSLTLTVVTPVSVLEKLRPVASMKRSGALTFGHRWHIFGLYLVFYLPGAALGFGLKWLLEQTHQPFNSDWIDEILQLFWLPLGAIFAVAIYLALVRKKEPAAVVDAQILDAFE